MDGETFQTVLDRTGNQVTKYVEFAEIPPTPARYVRLTLTGTPRVEGLPLGVIEFTIFGKPIAGP